MERYAKNAGAVHALRYHVVWCPKYRRPVLVDGVSLRLHELLTEQAGRYDIVILQSQILPDHVHLFVASDPTRSVAEIVNRLKGHTSHVLRQEFPWLRSRLPTLWSRSYYAATVGHVSEATIRRYIEGQKGR